MARCGWFCAFSDSERNFPLMPNVWYYDRSKLVIILAHEQLLESLFLYKGDIDMDINRRFRPCYDSWSIFSLCWRIWTTSGQQYSWQMSAMLKNVLFDLIIINLLRTVAGCRYFPESWPFWPNVHCPLEKTVDSVKTRYPSKAVLEWSNRRSWLWDLHVWDIYYMRLKNDTLNWRVNAILGTQRRHSKL